MISVEQWNEIRFRIDRHLLMNGFFCSCLYVLLIPEQGVNQRCVKRLPAAANFMKFVLVNLRQTTN